jgi:tetratricopeptide (TPR) repeat protein
MLNWGLMSKLAGTFLILACSLAGASACMQITGTTYDGHTKESSEPNKANYLRTFLSLDHREEGLQMQSELANSTNFNERSDYAVSLVYIGKTKEAVELLQTLEKQKPGTYVVAANLGTALELLGKNEEALHWIREGIRRNPQSHKGTEWLHAKILEAKIAQEKDPDYFKKHSVLELDPSRVSSSMTIDGRTFSPKQVAEAIEYQLQERLQFVKPPDPSVASLLFDYAAIEAATNILESAKGILKLAVEYGYPADRVEAQIKVYDRKIAAAKIRQIAFYIFITAMVTGGVIGSLVILYRAGIFVLSAKDLESRA